MKLYGTNTNDIFLTKEEEALFKLPVMELIVPDKLEEFKSVLRKISKLRLQRDSFLKAINGNKLKTNSKLQENLTSMIQKAEAKIKNSRSTTTGELEALVTEINENVGKIRGKMRKNGNAQDPFISKSAILLYIFLVRVVKYINDETKKLNSLTEEEEKKKVVSKLQMFGKKYIQLREELFLLFELQHVEPPIQSGSVNEANINNEIIEIIYYHIYKPFVNPKINEKSTLNNIKSISENIKTTSVKLPPRTYNMSQYNSFISNFNQGTIQSVVFIKEANEERMVSILTKRNHFYYKYKYQIKGNQIISYNPELIEDPKKYISIHQEYIRGFI